MKHSILWGGGGWYWEGEWAGLEWGRWPATSYPTHCVCTLTAVSQNAACWYPVCCGSATHGSWHAFFASLLSKNGSNGICWHAARLEKLAPPFSWMTPHPCQLLTLLSYLLGVMKHMCNLTLIAGILVHKISSHACNFKCSKWHGSES